MRAGGLAVAGNRDGDDKALAAVLKIARFAGVRVFQIRVTPSEFFNFAQSRHLLISFDSLRSPRMT